MFNVTSKLNVIFGLLLLPEKHFWKQGKKRKRERKKLL